MKTRDLLPGHARERTFKRPQEIETDIRAAALRQHIGCNRAQLAQLLNGSHASACHDSLRLWTEVWQVGDAVLLRHVGLVESR